MDSGACIRRRAVGPPPRALFRDRTRAIVGRAVKRTNLAGWLLVVAVTAVGEAAVRLFDLEDSVAAPSAAFRALGEGLASGTLSGEIGTTLESYVEGLAIAIVAGVVLGVLIGSSRVLLDASSVVIEFLRPIPAVAMIPLAIMFFGLGVEMRRFVIAYAAVWPILLNTIYGVQGSDRLLHDVARTSGVTSAGRLFRVALPAALPSIATGIRVSASIALLVGVTAEFITGTSGIGGYMQQQQLAFRLPELYAAVVLVGSLGYAINVGLRIAQRRAVFWVGEDRAGTR
jgi:ABC-type nitrate/sulfonate/bicarbonate transport system permease component